MSADAAQAFPQAFALREGQGAIVLHASGIRHPRFPRWLGETFTPWPDVTHHAVNSRALRLGTRRSVYVFPRRAFADPHAPDALAHAIVEQIARQPGGRAQLDRMWEAEKRASRPQPVRVAPALAALCVAVFALGFVPGAERLFFAGFFSDALVREGEWWRLATANFLHDGLAHVTLNTLCLLGVGPLVERILGSSRTLFVLGAAGLAGMGAGLLSHYEMAVGASGIVFGLAGALLWLELRCVDLLPCAWRVPRSLLLAALVGDGVLSLVLPGIAAAAHAGGLLAGFAASALVARPALERRPPRPWLVAADGAVIFALAASFAAVVSLFASGGSMLAQRGARLVDREGVGALTLNNFAWFIATDTRATQEDLDVAVRLAERAVEETERRDPNILDTLAEAQFQAGQAADAVRTIDEAIALAPDHDYFREQRRRFTGERDRDDRPESPPLWIEPEIPGPEEEPFEPQEEDGGFRV